MATKKESNIDLSKISARVERVHVSGLLRTYDDYVQRVADGLFKATNFQDLMRNAMSARSYLHELGVFKDIQVHIDVSKGEKAVDDGYEVTFKGTELSRIIGSVGTEVGQNEGSLRSELSFPNIFGRGESLSVQGSYSNTKANDLQVKFWKSFFHTQLVENRPEISISLFRRMDRMEVSSFQTSNIGLNADFSISTFKGAELRHSFQYETAIREISLLKKQAPLAIREHCGPTLASLLRYSVVYDQRDNPVFPTKGIMLRSINEYSGIGGNVHYMSHSTHGEMSVPLFGGIVAQLAGRVGIVKKTQKTRLLPLNNLYYCGGPLTIRGFKYGGAGPVVDGTPIGAEAYWCTGMHLWAPLPFSRVFKGLANNFRTHLFYNVGNYDNRFLENVRSAVGMGVAFKLADRARIELNYCMPLNSYSSDRLTDNNFQFGIGYEFV